MTFRNSKRFQRTFLGAAYAVLVLDCVSCVRTTATESRTATAAETPTVAVAEAK